MARNRLENSRILIVEPDADARRALAEILRAEGYTPLVAATGYAALEVLRHEKVSLAILDIQCSEPSGLDVLLQCNRLGLRVPVLLSSTSFSVTRAVAAMKAGARDYLNKPFKHHEVAEAVRSALETQHIAGEVMEDELRTAERFAAAGRLASGVVHDFNNLLTVILGYADLMHVSLPADHPARAYAAEIANAAEDSAALTSRLLAFSRAQVVEPSLVDLNETLRRREALLRRLLGDRIALDLRLDSAIGAIRADATQIDQVVMNLVINARDAMPAGGVVVIATQSLEITSVPPVTECARLGKPHSREADGQLPSQGSTGVFDLSEYPPNLLQRESGQGNTCSREAKMSIAEEARGTFQSISPLPEHPSLSPPYEGGAGGVLPPGRYITLTIHDTGHGMDGATLTRLFEPFFTTKRQGHGTGLGLATVHNIVRQWNGYITVASEPGKGSTFTVYFPQIASSGFARSNASDFGNLATAPIPAVELSGFETVILLENEPSVRNLIRLTLETHGYTVLEANSAEDALYLAAEYRGGVQLLISNLTTSDAANTDLAQRGVVARPGLKTLFITAHSNQALIDQVQKEGHTILHKPFTPDVLLAKVREALLKREVRNVG